MLKASQKPQKSVPKLSQMCSKSDAKSWSVRKMHSVIATALRCVESTFATTPELQNRFRNPWKFEAFSFKVAQKRPEASQMARNMEPNGGQKRNIFFFRKSDWLYLGRRPPPKAATGRSRCSQMASKMYEGSKCCNRAML